MSDDFPPTGFKATGITGVEQYIKSKSYKGVVKCPDCEHLRAKVQRIEKLVEKLTTENFQKSVRRWIEEEVDHE